MRWLQSIRILCIAEHLGEICYSLRTLGDVPLIAIQIHIPVLEEDNSLANLKALDAHVYNSRLSQLIKVQVHIIQTWIFMEDFEADVSEFEEIFKSWAKEAMPYCDMKHILEYQWLPKYDQGLDDSYRHELSESLSF